MLTVPDAALLITDQAASRLPLAIAGSGAGFPGETVRMTEPRPDPACGFGGNL